MNMVQASFALSGSLLLPPRLTQGTEKGWRVAEGIPGAVPAQVQLWMLP